MILKVQRVFDVSVRLLKTENSKEKIEGATNLTNGKKKKTYCPALSVKLIRSLKVIMVLNTEFRQN